MWKAERTTANSKSSLVHLIPRETQKHEQSASLTAALQRVPICLAKGNSLARNRHTVKLFMTILADNKLLTMTISFRYNPIDSLTERRVHP